MRRIMTNSEQQQNTDRVIKLPEVQSLTSLSRSTIYQKMKDLEFPSSIPLGARAVGWRYSQIIEWINKQAASSNAAQQGG